MQTDSIPIVVPECIKMFALSAFVPPSFPVVIAPIGSFVFMVSRGVSGVRRVASQNDPIIRLMLPTKKWDHCYYYGLNVLKANLKPT